MTIPIPVYVAVAALSGCAWAFLADFLAGVCRTQREYMGYGAATFLLLVLLNWWWAWYVFSGEGY